MRSAARVYHSRRRISDIFLGDRLTRRRRRPRKISSRPSVYYRRNDARARLDRRRLVIPGDKRGNRALSSRATGPTFTKELGFRDVRHARSCALKRGSLKSGSRQHSAFTFHCQATRVVRDREHHENVTLGSCVLLRDINFFFSPSSLIAYMTHLFLAACC